MAGGTGHIVQSLVVNGLIAAAKGVAALLTGSGAMLAETLHSAADCGNQVLLLVGVSRGQRAADASHPLGYGRAVYFWSFMVALLLFSGGGVFSIYEGIHKLAHPEPVTRPWLGIGILAFSIVLEGWALLGNLREMKRRRGDKPFFRYLRETKDSDLIVVFGENLAAVVGLGLALAALVVSALTGDASWDAVGSLAIGVVLVAVAVFLAREVQSLLLGEAADPELEAVVRREAASAEGIVEVIRILAVQEGPGKVMLALKVRIADDLSSREVVARINALERAIRAARPEVRWVFAEPDVAD